jgi:hypothetical protein
MSDNLKTTKTALAKLHQDMATINLLPKPSYLNVIEQMERSMEPINRQHLEIGRAFKMSGSMVWIQEIVNANQHWQGLIKQTTLASRIAESIAAPHQSWIDKIKPITHEFSCFSQLQATAKLAMCDTSLRLAVSERLMTGIDFKAIMKRFQVETPIIAGLEKSIAHVTTSYGSLAKSLNEIADITRLPVFIFPGASREICTTSFALDTLRTRDERDEDETEIQIIAEAEQETSGCIELLQHIDPRLARPYIGARDALHGNNPDRTRHILSSLRELWNHLLWRLAPDDLVTPWISNMTNQRDLLHDGKPTRQARILYVCRKLNNDSLTDFLIQDTRALVKMIELFNRVHELETKLTDLQLRAILLKTDSWLMYILQILLCDVRK